jgi:AcrR family transcriptional regulator
MAGLREDKRERTRRELARTAYELVTVYGLDHVTIEQVVDRIPVSRRTFFNYFSCKEEAVAAAIMDRVRDGLGAWTPTPAADGLINLVRDMVHYQLDSGALRAVFDGAALAVAHPHLEPYWRAAAWEAWQATGTRVRAELLARAERPAAELGLTDSLDLTAVMGALYATVVSCAATSAADSARPRTPVAPGPVAPTDALGPIIDRVLDRLGTGLRSAPSQASEGASAGEDY